MQPALNILHVEDDPGDALLMQEILMAEVGISTFDVVHVESLKDAITELNKRGFNAVLLDLGLRDVSGVDNVRIIKEENPDIPIVVLTGVDNEDIAMQALQKGAQEYLVKGHGDGKVIRLAIKSSIQRKAVERQLYHQANYDELTGLANRRLFMEHLEKALIKAKRWKREEALMFLDLNNFKTINDTYGHEAGNELLKQTASRLSSILRESDLVARYGGDEFMWLLDNSAADIKQGCETVANKMIEIMNEPFILGNNSNQISVSIGIAIYPDCADDAASMIDVADMAMYKAKSHGANRYCFAPSVKTSLLL
ncbi:MAG: hypothetical protein COV36_01505 [Alphaproteobacteria bacterium CG11_big_fil_rev_8_21_14_0_20_44_7]|nr:MAG: hypothetical protein COV36_01505 [Alphaproteobacteria bacterium CG11_big_fil_rev_8_21_14_0_20_44_7]